MTKRLIDIDDELLLAAQARLGCDTFKATVNQALAEVVQAHRARLDRAMDVLSRMPEFDREEAWR